MHVERLDHLVLTVGDLMATIDFYTNALGMELVSFADGRKAVAFGNQKINLHEAGHEFEPKALDATPGSGDLCFVTETSLDEWLRHFVGLGVAIELGPVERIGTLGAMRSIYVRDPDGNLIEIANY